MQSGSTHEALKPLTWLVGKWRSVKAEGKLPYSRQPFSYSEELTFEPYNNVGHPVLGYTSKTWSSTQKKEMHSEKGFLRVNPGTNQLGFMVTMAAGIFSLEEGSFSDNKIQLKTLEVRRLNFKPGKKIAGFERSYQIRKDGKLEYVQKMEISDICPAEHVRVLYEKCN